MQKHSGMFWQPKLTLFNCKMLSLPKRKTTNTGSINNLFKELFN
jgi:hypothetical protein